MDTIKVRQLLGLLCGVILCVPVSFADTSTVGSNWFVGGTGGWSWPSLSKSSTSISAGDGQMDLYSIDKPKSAASFSLDGGYRWVRQDRWFPSYSLALRFQHLTNTEVTGTVDQDSLPGYVNYNYSLNVSSNVLGLAGKLDIYRIGSFAPYVSASVGEAFNRADSYDEQADAGVMARVSPDFDSHTTANFAYSAGTGVDYYYNKKLWMSLGYEYANLGTVKTANGATTWSGESLTFGKLTTSNVSLGVFYQLPFA